MFLVSSKKKVAHPQGGQDYLSPIVLLRCLFDVCWFIRVAGGLFLMIIVIMVSQKLMSGLPTRYSGLVKKLRRTLAQLTFPYVSTDYAGAANNLINTPAYQ